MKHSETRTRLSLVNQAIEINYEKNEGRWGLLSRSDSRYGIEDVSSTAIFRSGASYVTSSSREAYLRTWKVEPFANQLGSGQQLVVTNFGREDAPELVQVIRLYELERYVTCGAIIRNGMPEKMELSEVRLELKPKMGTGTEYPEAVPITLFLDNSYSYETPILERLEEGRTYSGWNYGLLSLNGSGVFAGSIREDKTLPLLQVSRDGATINLRCRSNFSNLGLEPGDFVESGEFLLIAGLGVSDIREDYSRALKRLIRVERHEQQLFSWQLSPRHEASSTEDGMKKVLDGLAEKLHALGVKYLEVGEGWQKEIGDWTPSADFSEGLKSIAEKIRNVGFSPGIWIAPLIVSENSWITSQNSDWLIRGIDRNPMKVRLRSGGDFFLLNPAMPAVRDYLQQLISRLVDESGFELIILDSTYPLTYLDYATDEGETAASLHSLLMKAIRAAAPGKPVIVSNCLVGQSVGYAEGVRVGEPIADFERLLDGTRSTSLRYFLDRDLLTVTTNVFDIEKMGAEHFRSWATFSAVVCRSITVSGSGLSRDVEDVLNNLLPISMEAFRPLLGVAGQGDPVVWATTAEERRGVKVAVFNWSLVSRKVEINFKDLGLRQGRQYAAIERWKREFLGIHDHGLEIEVSPGGCRVLFVFDASETPLLLFGLRNHLVDGPLETATWDSSKGSLHGEFSSESGKSANLVIYCPPNMSPKSLHAIGCEYSMEIVSDNVFELQFTSMSEKIKWMLTLRRTQ